MSETTPTKPYFVRALHEWCVDNGFTPYLAVRVDARTRVPPAHVREGEIVLNIGYAATKGLMIDNDAITFAARFGGASFDIYVPMEAVQAIFARENGQGMSFELVVPDVDAAASADDDGDDGDEAASTAVPDPEPDPEPTKPGKPSLRLVK